MRKISIFLFILNLCLFASVTFEKILGGTGDDVANSIRQTSDGGYIIAGSKVDSINYKLSYLTITKINSLGEKEWGQAYSGGITSSILNNVGNSVIQTNDGGFAVAGCIDHLYHCIHSDLYVLKTDSAGNKTWDFHYAYDSSVSSTAFQITQTDDNGYIILGNDFGITVLVKLNSEGIEEWVNYDYSQIEGRSIIQTDDKGFVFTGYDDEHLILVKTDSLGNEVWNKNYGGMISQGYSVKQSSDGGFVILGKTGQLNYADVAWLIKTDANGELEWSKEYGSIGGNFPDYIGQSIDLGFNGGYILAGYSHIYGVAQAWLMKVDSEGNEIWEKTYGVAGDDRVHSVQQTLDGGYILAGCTDSFGAGGKDMWIIKTDENGTEIESPFLPQTAELHQNYPNPFNPSTEISYSLKSEGMVMLSVFNTKGELVRTLVNEKKTAGNHSINFNGEGLNSGIYFYKLNVDGKAVQSRKMILLK